jgi:hypothetical protein
MQGMLLNWLRGIISQFSLAMRAVERPAEHRPLTSHGKSGVFAYEVLLGDQPRRPVPGRRLSGNHARADPIVPCSVKKQSTISLRRRVTRHSS